MNYILAPKAAKYRQLEKHMAQMEVLVLELMRHPDATPEQLMEMHESYSRLYPQVRRIRQTLIQKGVLRS